MGEVEIVTENDAALMVPDEVIDMERVVRLLWTRRDQNQHPNPKSDKSQSRTFADLLGQSCLRSVKAT